MFEFDISFWKRFGRSGRNEEKGVGLFWQLEIRLPYTVVACSDPLPRRQYQRIMNFDSCRLKVWNNVKSVRDAYDGEEYGDAVRSVMV